MSESGWTAHEISEKTPLRFEDIQQWMKYDTDVKVRDLRLIAKTINRPFTVFLLSEPPEEKDLIDYRRVGGSGIGNLSKKALTIIRDAKYAQSIAAELLDMRSEDVRPHVIRRDLKDNPQIVAKMERESLRLGLEGRPKGTKMDAFVKDKYLTLRAKIELLNIFVMQAPMEIGEARGFTLPGGCPKVILINSKDDPRPKLFTLLHEYAHILLNTDGVCLTDAHDIGEQYTDHNASVERWCNNFAGAFIMPKEAFLNEFASKPNYTPKQMSQHLSSKFCASKTAVVVRILNLLDDDSLKKEYLEQYHNMAKSATKTIRRGGQGGRDMPKECVNRYGRRYVKLVFDSEKKGLITTHDMLEYLDLKLKHFEKVEALV